MKMNRKLSLLLNLAFWGLCCAGWAQLTPERVAELEAELEEEGGGVVQEEKVVVDEDEGVKSVILDPEAFKDSLFMMEGWALTSDLNLKNPFDAAELRKLLELTEAQREEQEDRLIMMLLLHAGIKKDASFTEHIDDEELRKVPNIALALSAYDYMIQGTPAALDFILAQLAIEPVGSDCDAIVVMKPLNEWDRTIRAFRKHFVNFDSDGAAVAAITGFNSTRAYLFPEKYAEVKEVLTAPMAWTDPLPALE